MIEIIKKFFKKKNLNEFNITDDFKDFIRDVRKLKQVEPKLSFNECYNITLKWYELMSLKDEKLVRIERDKIELQKEISQKKNKSQKELHHNYGQNSQSSL